MERVKEKKMRVVLDTYAWIEYFRGTIKGEKVRKYLEKEEAITPSIVLLELSCKAAEEGLNFEKTLEFIKLKSLVMGFNEEIIFNCGKIYHKIRKNIKHFGLPDSVILTTAINTNSFILTGDKHFEGLQNVIML